MPYPFTYGYCEQGDVESLFKNIGSYTKLDADEIGARIADAAADIDAELNAVYVTPVSADPVALALLSRINSRMAAAEIHAIFTGSAGGDVDKVVPIVKMWRDWATGKLERVRTGVLQFLTAPGRLEGTIYPKGNAADFNSDMDDALDPENGPVFKRFGRPMIDIDTM